MFKKKSLIKERKRIDENTAVKDNFIKDLYSNLLFCE